MDEVGEREKRRRRDEETERRRDEEAGEIGLMFKKSFIYFGGELWVPLW